MKKIVLFSFFLLWSVTGFSQNIIDFFLALPEEAFNIPKKERQEIVSYSKDNRSEKDMRLDLQTKDKSFWADIKNGYLYLTDKTDDLTYEICFWNCSNGNKLIAIYSQRTNTLTMIDKFDFPI